MRPNLAQDAPPTSITIGGRDYDCKPSFNLHAHAVDLRVNLDFHRNLL